jgi:hypothetical protein
MGPCFRRDDGWDSIFKEPNAVIASEAKQSTFLAKMKEAGLLRRYAPRNDGRHNSAFSPRVFARGLLEISLPSKQRAQGMPGARCARSLAGRKKATPAGSRHGHTGFTRHSPRNGFTVSFVLSPVIGLSCHRHRRITPPT